MATKLKAIRPPGSDTPEQIRTHSPKLLVSVLLGHGDSITAAARKAKVGRSTIYEWLRDDPEFVELVQAHTAQVAKSIGRTLMAAKVEAVQQLRRLARDKGVDAGARIKACEAILNCEDPLPRIFEQRTVVLTQVQEAERVRQQEEMRLLLAASDHEIEEFNRLYGAGT